MLTCHAIVAGTLALTPAATREMQKYLMESHNVEANYAKEGIYLDNECSLPVSIVKPGSCEHVQRSNYVRRRS